MSSLECDDKESLEKGIACPHDHDVLSGRGNFVNYHAGNEYFRSLVRSHKIAYIACPKPQKGKFSRIIVDEIRNRNPPGRFLKQDSETKLWFDIGDKKALDKTRQALREGAPELLKDLDPDDEDYDEEVNPTMSHIVPHMFVGSSGFMGGESSAYHLTSQGQLSTSTPTPTTITSSNQLPVSQQLQADREVTRMIQAHSTGADTTYLAPMRGSNTFSTLSNGFVASAENVRQVMSMYIPDQFEPTPINPNAQLKIIPNEVPSSAPLRRGLQRDDSFTFEHLFKEKPISEKTSKKMENSSQHLSAMSFSIGDMTEASNLSAVFQDSMRISEDAPSMYPKFDTNRKIPSTSHIHGSEIKKKAISATETSVTSSLGSFALENSMMQMSFKSGFDDESSKGLK